MHFEFWTRTAGLLGLTAALACGLGDRDEKAMSAGGWEDGTDGPSGGSQGDGDDADSGNDANDIPRPEDDDGGDEGGGPMGCHDEPEGVGQNSKLEWPTGSVARDAQFTLGWQNGSDGGGCPGDWSIKNGPFLGDIDGDGNLDLAADIRKGSVVRLYGDGNGGFGSPLPLSGCSSGGSVDFGDYDNDGDIDILNGSHSGNGHVYTNNGGGFSETTLNVGAGLQGSAWGDFNGDGYLDAVLGADQFASGSWVFLNDTQGGFVNAGAIGNGSPVNFANIVTGDFDNDGDIDMFGFIDYDFQGLGGTPNGPTLFLNGGDGTSWTTGTTLADPFPGGAGQPEGIATGDLDCDGNLDVVMSGKVFLGDGNGGLQNSATLKTHTFGPFMNLGDMDGDDHLDVIIADSMTGFRIFYGDGSGSNFEEVAGVGLPADAYTWFDVGDVDNSGNLDIVTFYFDAGNLMQAWVR